MTMFAGAALSAGVALEVDAALDGAGPATVTPSAIGGATAAGARSAASG